MCKTTSKIEISRSAFENNIQFLKGIIGEDVRFSSVVKGNAYGHGIEYFVPMAEEAGIDHFSVFSGDEACRVFEASGGHSDIMVMGWLDTDQLQWAIENGISFWVFETNRLEKAIEIAKETGNKAKIHLEVETGMNRTGLSEEVLGKVIQKIKKNRDHLSLEGLCTHYAGAESVANYLRIKKQISRFNTIYRRIKKSGLTPAYRHTACSAAAFNYPKTRMDMVRIGIMQYGYWPSNETFIQYVSGMENRNDPLDRIISWKSQVMSIKKVNEGEFVSYGTTYLAQDTRLIAIVPVGYSHGFSRSLSNQGRVLIGGNRVGVIGMVNMNMLIADVTFVPGVSVGEEVIIVGKQGKLEISIASFSEISNQLNYEMLTRLPERISRVITS